MKLFYLKLHPKISLVALALCTFLTNNLIAQEPSLKKSKLQNTNIIQPTSLEFGPDGKLYVAERFGRIWQYTIERDDADAGNGTYSVVEETKIEAIINNTANHSDSGIFVTETKRQVTGIVTAGTAENPIIYASSSDSRVGGSDFGDVNLDTNSGILHKLEWNGNEWIKTDLIRGLPRCEENHASNGMDLFEKNGISYLLLQQGGHANQGAPSNKFAGTPEYFLSGALLIVNLTQLESMPIYTDPRSNSQYVYDLPTLNDPEREDIDNTHPEFPYPSGHPMYNATIDIRDPFGGNDSFNQAFAEPGGPVQVFAYGFRNAFDVLIKEDGKIYTIDNGPNGTWGGLPLIYNNGILKGDQNAVDYQPENGDYVTNEFEINSGIGHGDALHYVGTTNDENETYYGGHINPTAAFPSRAGIIKFAEEEGEWIEIARTDLATTITGVSGYFNPSFNLSDFPDNPRIGNHLAGKINNPDVNILDIYNLSTNGLCEYTASTFDSALKGHILTVSFDGNIRKFEFDTDGTTILSKKDQFGSSDTIILDVTAVGDGTAFAGTVWATEIFANSIIVFEPDNTICIAIDDPEFDPLADYDSDGYSNQDEIDSGTNYCSAGNAPKDFDKDFISNINDPDDDNDSIPDALDAFAIDPDNGTTLNLPVKHPFWNFDPATGFFGLGFMGLMVDPSGNTDYLSQFDLENISFGGAAGKASIDLIPKGTAKGANNNQAYGFQFGVNVDNTSNPFTIHSRVESPFFATEGTPNAPIEDQAIGIYIGTGDQDNYLSIQLQNGSTPNDNLSGIAVLLEDQGIISIENKIDIPNILSANNLDIYLTINPSLNTAQPYISLNGGSTIISAGDEVALPASFLDANDNKGLAVGIIASAAGATAPEFAAAWDFINITEDLEGVIEANTPLLDFKIVSKDAAPLESSIILNNLSGPGNPEIIITDITITGADASLFSTNEPTPFGIGSGSSFNLPIDLIPDGSVGTKEAVLEIAHTGTNSPLSIPITVELTDQTLFPIYRINTGGSTVSSADDGPDWFANTTIGSQSGIGYTVNTGNIATGNLSASNKDGSIPDYIDDITFNAIFKQERWDSAGNTEMEFEIPLPNDSYEVNLYVGNSYFGTDQIGERVFDILLEGTIVKDDLDAVAEFGHRAGGMLSFPVTIKDGSLNISFAHEPGKDNPIINAIEVLGLTAISYPINIEPIADRTDFFDNTISIQTIASGGNASKDFSYTISGQPASITIDENTGVISGVLTEADLDGGESHDGVHNVFVTAKQPDEEEVTINFIWAITDPGDALWIDMDENENYTSRHECSFVQAGDKFFLMGGRENAKSVNVYNYQTDNWDTVSNIAPKEFNHFQAITYQGLIWIIGAFETNTFPNEAPATHIQIYNPTNQEWIEGPEIPVTRRRGGAGLVLHNDKFYLVGGNTMGHNGGYVSWFDEYDPATGTWTPLADAPHARDHFHAGLLDNKLYAAGGRLSGGDGGVFAPLIPEVDVYDFETNSWTTLATTNNIPTPRAGAAVAIFNDELFVIGGEGVDIPNQNPDPAFDVVEAYNPDTSSWSTKTPLNHARHGTQAIVSGNGIFITAGSPNRAGGSQKNMEVYNSFNPFGIPDTESRLLIPEIVEFDTNETKTILLKTIEGTAGTFIKSIAIDGGDTNSFNITGGALTNSMLPGFSSHPIEVTYLESALGKTATLTITYNSNTTKTIVLQATKTFYRVNAGGMTQEYPLIDWQEDQATTGSGIAVGSANTGVASPYLDLSNNNDDTTYGANTAGFTNTTGYPDVLFNHERFNNNNVPSNMQWDFPLPLGHYQVNLLFAERFIGNKNIGDRVFDIEIEGIKVAEDFDQVEIFGYNTAGVARFEDILVADGNLDLDFIKNIENPNIKAIEIILTRKVLNTHPVVTNPGTIYSYTEQEITLQIEATDGDDDTTQILSYEAQNLPDGLTIDSTTGLISGTVNLTAVINSPYNVLITVTDDGQDTLATEISFDWVITEITTNQGSISSTVNLQGRNDHSGTYTIAFYSTDNLTTPAYEFSPSAKTSGSFIELPITQGTYKIAINYPGYLQKVIETSITQTMQPLDFGQLKGGDINGDNKITISDLSALNSVFNTDSTANNFISKADINNDQKITILDLSILSSNFNTQGDSIE